MTVTREVGRTTEGAPPAPAAQPHAGLADLVRKGAFWSAASSVLMRFANVGLMAVVARIVDPEHLGLFALAMVVQAFIASVAELGVASAVARSDLDPDRIAPTVTTIAIVVSGGLAAAMAIFAQPLANALNAPEAAASLRILAISVALVGPFAVPGAQLQREFRQGRLFLANVVSFVPSSAVLVLVALQGDGAVAFAWSRVVGQLVVGVIMVASVSRLYRPGFSARELGPLVAFGLPLAGANLLSQLVVNVDYVVVGRVVDVEAVGVYMLAFNVAGWATAAIGSMLNGVVLPAFSRARSDPGRLPGIVAQATRSVAVIACLISAMTAALAAPLIRVLYGSRWGAAAPVLSVLAVYGVVAVLSLLFANITIAMGRTGVLLAVQVAALVALTPLMVVFVRLWGIRGAGLAHVVVACGVTLPVYLLALRRATGSELRRLALAVLPPVVAGVAAFLVAHVVGDLLTSPVAQVVLGGSCGTAVYVLLMGDEIVTIAGRVTPSGARRLVDSTRWCRRWLVAGRPVVEAVL